jgi:hypothetical protein
MTQKHEDTRNKRKSLNRTNIPLERGMINISICYIYHWKIFEIKMTSCGLYLILLTSTAGYGLLDNFRKFFLTFT